MRSSERLRRLQLGALVGVGVAGLVLLLWWLNLFVTLRLRLSDFYYVPQPTTGNVVIVAVDDTSIREFGAYQDWLRARYAALVDTLAGANARVIAFDMLFIEPRGGDAVLAVAMARAREDGVRFVLPAAGFTEGSFAHFESELAPLETFAEHALHIGYVNTYPDADGTVRRYMTQGEHNGEQRFSLGLATYLAYFNVSPTLAAQTVEINAGAATLPDGSTIPLDEHGLWMLNYFGAPSTAQTNRTFAVYSVSDVLAGAVAPSAFDDKIVLVGLLDATGAVDERLTPISSELMAGVEINANAIETLLQGAPLRDESRLSQVVTIVVLALVSALLFAQLRWYSMVVLALGIIILWLVYASVMVSVGRVILNPLHPLMTVALVLLASIGVRVSDEIRQRQHVESLLQTVVQVSQQQMELGRIIPLITDDLQTMTGAQAGVLWLTDDDGTLRVAQTWGGERVFGQLSRRVAATERSQVEGRLVAVPVVWQGRVSAVLAVRLSSFGQPPHAARRQLERFAERVAANVENARLYTEVRHQNQLLQGILSESPAGILVLDAALNIQQYNDSAAAWLGFSPDDFIGQPVSAALEASPIDKATWQQIGENLLGKAHFRQEIEISGRTYQLDAAHIPGGGRWVITLSDITELAELSQMKTRMIRMASHDLKNPIGRIAGYGELMQEMLADEGDENAEQYLLFLNRMVKSAEEMNEIISEILSLEHVRAGRIEREPLSMANVVQNTVERYETDATDKQQMLAVDLDNDLPLVRGDFNQLVQAVSNLVSNAIKYTPPEGHIRVRLCQRDTMVRLEVQDDGYGMPAEAQEHLFTEFYRVRTEQTKNIKGTGLGLSLVKSVIEVHGGKIWVESELNEGSTFYVELPGAET